MVTTGARPILVRARRPDQRKLDHPVLSLNCFGAAVQVLAVPVITTRNNEQVSASAIGRLIIDFLWY